MIKRSGPLLRRYDAQEILDASFLMKLFNILSKSDAPCAISERGRYIDEFMMDLSPKEQKQVASTLPSSLRDGKFRSHLKRLIKGVDQCNC